MVLDQERSGDNHRRAYCLRVMKVIQIARVDAKDYIWMRIEGRTYENSMDSNIALCRCKCINKSEGSKIVLISESVCLSLIDRTSLSLSFSPYNRMNNII